MLKRIAQRIKSLREERRLSQEDMYFDTEIHIGRIETSKVNISISTLQEICEYFDLSLTDFFKDIDTGEEENEDKSI